MEAIFAVVDTTQAVLKNSGMHGIPESFSGIIFTTA